MAVVLGELDLQERKGDLMCCLSWEKMTCRKMKGDLLCMAVILEELDLQEQEDFSITYARHVWLKYSLVRLASLFDRTRLSKAAMSQCQCIKLESGNVVAARPEGCHSCLVTESSVHDRTAYTASGKPCLGAATTRCMSNNM